MRTQRPIPVPAPPVAARHRRHRRRGIAAVMAMLYLLIFSTLALGFYSAVTMAAQVAQNDEKSMGARVAAESGMDFMRYQLSRVSMPGDTAHELVLGEIHRDLAAANGTSSNLGGRAIGLTATTIEFPAGTDQYIRLDDKGTEFRATITDIGMGIVSVKVHGRYRGRLITRTVSLDFESAYKSLRLFDFGIVTRGPIDISGGGIIGGGQTATHGSILSMSTQSTPISMSGTSGVAGDVYMTNPIGNVDISGGGVSIAGTTIPAVREEHIHRGVEPPEIPEVNSALFRPYATNTYDRNASEHINVLIPPNTNPTFNSDATIKGVMYIQYPNKVTFNSKVVIRGTIVVENGATPSRNNVISIAGGVEAYGMDTLPPDAQFPEGLRKLRGSTLLAPGFHVSLGGTSGSIGGIMLAHSFEFAGGSGGIIEGTFIGLGDVTMKFTGGASINRTKPPEDQIPAGLVFTKTFKPMPRTYRELTN